MSNSNSSMSRDAQVDNNSNDTDPRQLFLPHVDTAIDVTGGRLPFKISIVTAALAFPAIAFLAGGLWMSLQGSPVLGVGLVVLSVVAGFGAMAATIGSNWAMYPHERVLDAFHHTKRRFSLPWGYADAVAHADDLHGTKECITIDIGERDPTTYAGMQTHDGKAIVPIRLVGSNTEFLRAGELGTLAGAVTQSLDSEISEGGDEIAFYSTTRPAMSNVANEYLSRAEDGWKTRLNPFQSGLLGEVGEWVDQRDEETGANVTDHYLMVTADDDRETLEIRLREALNAVGGFEHAEAEAVSPREVVNLAAEYWHRTPYPAGDVGDAAAEAAVPPTDVSDLTDEEEGTTETERAVAPEWYAEKSRHVEVGDALARTFWVSNWPEQPPVKFLHGLYTMSGVDLDIKLYGHPKIRDGVITQLSRQIPRIDAEGMDRAESMDVSSITIDDDLSAYVLAYKLLQSVNTQPWGVSGYVTVRAPDQDRLKMACDRVKKELKSPPARVTLSAPFGDQHAAFRSASPFSRDHYGEKGKVRRRATKTHLALGGVFGAALPAATPNKDDEGGIRWGRDDSTGRTVQADPFKQGMAPHLITVGPSGSGKTFSVKQASQEWYLNGEDRTVIYCDTQGGFEDVVEAHGAEHILVDGQRGINPLDIRPAAEHDHNATGGDYNQYRLKVTEATEFFCGIIRSHGADPADYHAIIEQGIEQTYRDAGITSESETHSNPSPTPEDLFNTLEKMMKSPSDYTFTDEGPEIDKLEDRIADLLSELSGFKPNGKYHNILNETTDGLNKDTELAYLDMRHLAGQTGGATSVNLQLAVGQVTQLIKQTKGETIFVIDEAHNLLHSPEMVDWLNKAAREWRRYDAALWFVTQSPQEFVRHAGDSGSENKRETIVEQCSTIQIMNAPLVKARTLEEFNIPPQHAETVQKDLVPGSGDKDYSECVLSFNSERGWIRTRVEANPIFAKSIEYSYRTGQSYREQMLAALAEYDDEIDVSDVDKDPDGSDPIEVDQHAAGMMGEVATDGSGETNE